MRRRSPTSRRPLTLLACLLGLSACGSAARTERAEALYSRGQGQWQAARRALTEAGDLAACAQQLHALATEQPTHPLADDALWLLAHLYRHIGLWAQAAQTFEAATFDREGTSWFVGSYRRPRQPDAGLWVARVHWLAGDPHRALAAYARVLDRDPHSLSAARAAQERARLEAGGAPDARWRDGPLSQQARAVGW